PPVEVLADHERERVAFLLGTKLAITRYYPRRFAGSLPIAAIEYLAIEEDDLLEEPTVRLDRGTEFVEFISLHQWEQIGDRVILNLGHTISCQNVEILTCGSSSISSKGRSIRLQGDRQRCVWSSSIVSKSRSSMVTGWSAPSATAASEL